MTDTEILGKLQELHGCSREMVLYWCEHSAKNCNAMYKAGLDRAARDKARLDWWQDNAASGLVWKDTRGAWCVHGVSNPFPYFREAIDAARELKP